MSISTHARTPLPIWAKPAILTTLAAAGDALGPWNPARQELGGLFPERCSLAWWGASAPLVSPSSLCLPHCPSPSPPAPGGTSWRPDAVRQRYAGLSSDTSPRRAGAHMWIKLPWEIIAGEREVLFSAPKSSQKTRQSGCGPLEGAAASTGDECPFYRVATSLTLRCWVLLRPDGHSM